MEKIKVNMSPNPLDVQTIHASQDDGEARQWEFELHNNGELIDTSNVTEQMFFKAYKGGTEQLLPENTSTPTTSPFLGDIRYPQGLLADQEFTYRQSPTEEDGLAKITDVKGNTLVWNQLAENGNFDSATGWGGNNSSITVANNVLTGTIITSHATAGLRKMDNVSFVANHKYLISAVMSCSVASDYCVARFYATGYDFRTDALTISANTKKRQVWILTPTSAFSGSLYIYPKYSYPEPLAVGDTFTFEKVMLIDLTQMGLDISSPSDFTSLFPLSYYSYNQGSLLSFNGNGIKTVGKNQFGEIQVGMRTNANTGVIEPSSNTNWVSKKIFTNGKINVLALSSNGYTGSINIAEYDANGNYIQNTNFFYGTNISGNYRASKTLNANTAYVIPNGYQTGGASAITGAEIELSTYDIETYEPYTSSTLSLPISTYFPNGMKSAGNVYDELTESKAITRIGAVDLGSLNWIHRTEIGQGIFSCDVTSTVLYKRQPSVNFEVAQYINGGTVTGVVAMVEKANMTVCLYYTGNNNSRFIYAKNTTYSDGTAFKTAMNGIPLFFELTTYEETSFTTASLVTENAEIPLSNNDGTLIGKCTEELSAEPGFHDAKIKLSDGDGTCYSNKLQLHVERKP